MSGSRPVVLTFLRYYLPGEKSGGPVRTVANMVDALGDELDFRIVTSDRDVGDTQPFSGVGNGWCAVGKARVLYLAPARRRFTSIASILCDTKHDTLYLNSFFDPLFTAMPLLARRGGRAPASRCVLAPRGEFSPAALQLKSLKKRSYRAAAHMLGLHRGLIWQASGPRESADIAREMSGIATDIRVAPNLTAPLVGGDAPVHLQRVEADPIRVVFLSRISPMKNLDFALAVLQQVKVPIVFDIYGQPEDQLYWAACRERISMLPRHISARYCGAVPHRDVAATLARYDLFFLPTRGENYGHAIVESLAAGTPVLISDATPWRNLSDLGIGWDLPLTDPSAFARRLEQLSAENKAKTDLRRQRAAEFSRELAAHGGAREESLSLFHPHRYLPPVLERGQR